MTILYRITKFGKIEQDLTTLKLPRGNERHKDARSSARANVIILHQVFRCVHASLKEGLSVRPSIRRSISVTRFFDCAKTSVFDFGRRVEGRGCVEGAEK